MTLPLRQRERIALAKQRGAYRGRRKELSLEQVGDLRRRAMAGEQKSTLAREFKISRETVYQCLRTACPDVTVESIQDASIAAPQIQK